jgi:hypothetical protein
MPAPIVAPRRIVPPAVHSATLPGATTVPLGQPAAPHDATTPVGRYRCDRRGENWWWSPEMFRLYGLAPDAALPCCQLLLDHVEPTDRPRLAEALAGACSGRAFALELHAVGAGARPASLVLIGEPTHDGDGAVLGVEGVCVEVTEGRRGEEGRTRELETEVAQLRAAMASRAAIEQAKGILMLLTTCGDQVAFGLLAHISSHTHRKVREVAQAITESASGHGRLPDDIRAILHDACPPSSG